MAIKEITLKARRLRRQATDAERRLWYLLRQRLSHVKFRRQHPIPPYIADFACPAHRLVVELDGSQHFQQQDYDQRREAFMRMHGWRSLRFWNDQVFREPEVVLEVIYRMLEE